MTPIQTPKKRYEWIDNSRVIASFLIMYVHLPLALPDTNLFTNEVVHKLCVQSAYSGRVAMFCILSGYLFGRNAPWGKTLDRFFWLLVPYVLWNLIILAAHWLQNPDMNVNMWAVFGIGAVFKDTWVFTSAGACPPIFDHPAWYMRDMLPLTLITPILVKYKKYLPFALLLFALFRTDHLYMNPKVMMSPSTCFFYVVGICLTRFKVEDGYRIFNDKFTPVVLLALVAAIFASVRQTVFHGPAVPISLLGMLMGAMMIAHGGVMIEQHLPKLSKKMAPLGPASFLVFMIHWPIFYGVAHLFPAIKSSLWILLLPLPTYAIVVMVFLSMKHFTPWLMPYLGHMKIRVKTQHS